MLSKTNPLIKSTISFMFDPSIDGFLYIPAWPVYMETEESGNIYKIKLEYDNKEEAINKVLNEADSLLQGIHLLGEWYGKKEVPFGLSPNRESIKAGITETEWKMAKLAWERYLKNFNNQEEADILLKDCKRRVGNGLAAYHEVIRAVRLIRLISLGAADLVKDHEEVLFIKALVVNHYATSLEMINHETSDPLLDLLKDLDGSEGYGLMVRDGML